MTEAIHEENVSPVGKISHWLSDRFSRKADMMSPPEDYAYQHGGEAFVQIGEEFMKYFVDFGRVKPSDKVLDIGCGCGRMAVPLTSYLDPDAGAAYEGFDVTPEWIKWCKRAITPRFPHFRFQVADVYNAMYNRGGKQKSTEYVFPYPDGHFDFVFLTSVFTHMLPADVEHYLAEISRVLKPGGRCLITYFLTTAEALQLIAEGKSHRELVYECDGYRTENQETVEAAIGYDEQYIRDLHSRLGAPVVEPIRFGAWCGREQHTSYQDIVIGEKA